jgi:hypothetical protein
MRAELASVPNPVPSAAIDALRQIYPDTKPVEIVAHANGPTRLPHQRSHAGRTQSGTERRAGLPLHVCLADSCIGRNGPRLSIEARFRLCSTTPTVAHIKPAAPKKHGRWPPKSAMHRSPLRVQKVGRNPLPPGRLELGPGIGLPWQSLAHESITGDSTCERPLTVKTPRGKTIRVLCLQRALSGEGLEKIP